MCIVFLFNGSNDENNDFNFIMVSNRDESYCRPATQAGYWVEDNEIIGGRDMAPGCEGGTWMAISPKHLKLGLLLNLPGHHKSNAKSRGKIVEDFVKSSQTCQEYINSMQLYSKNCNDFIFLMVELRKCGGSIIKTYDNATSQLKMWPEPCLGFSNSLPDTPLKKVEAGTSRFRDICSHFNKISLKDQLIEELIKLLQWDEKHLPDQELQRRNPSYFENLSSVYVRIPEMRYGTRTHSIVLVEKSGSAHFIELTMKSPIDPQKPEWIKNEFQFEI